MNTIKRLVFGAFLTLSAQVLPTVVEAHEAADNVEHLPVDPVDESEPKVTAKPLEDYEANIEEIAGLKEQYGLEFD